MVILTTNFFLCEFDFAPLVIKQQRIYHYLKTNPDFLKDYIIDHVGDDKIKRWISDKASQPDSFVQQKGQELLPNLE